MDWCAKNNYPTNWSVKAGDQVQTLVQLLPQSSGIYSTQHHVTHQELHCCYLQR
jgi:hypothetical protein